MDSTINSEPSEGLAFKKNLMKLLKSNNITLNDLEINISSSDEEISDGDDDFLRKTPKNIETTAEDKDKNEVKNNFQIEFTQAQKSLDEIPTLLALFNTEMEMLSKDRMLVRTLPSEDDDLEEFIWKFHIKIECENNEYHLPIQRVEDIEKLNDTLNDEAIFHKVVSFDCS